MRVNEAKVHSGTIVAKLEGIETREQALGLKGATVSVERAALPPAEGEVVHTKHTRRYCILPRRLAQATEQSVRTDGETEFSRQASARLTSEGKADQL